jgi:hypothetical protein
MKKTLLFILFLVSVRSFAQTDLSYHYQIPKQLNDALQTASLSDVGIDSNEIINLTNKILADKYINIHSLLILRYNKLVYTDGQMALRIQNKNYSKGIQIITLVPQAFFCSLYKSIMLIPAGIFIFFLSVNNLSREIVVANDL